MPQVKRMVIIEGPAGSGKSTLIDKLHTGEWARKREPLLNLPRPRSYEGIYGNQLSQIKDHLAVLDLLSDDPEKTPLLVDRFFFSQMVYNAIRTGKDEISHTMVHRLLASLKLSVLCASQEWQSRCDATQPYEPYAVTHHLHFHFILPALPLLRERRSKTDREFPFSAEQELALYIHAHLYLKSILGTKDFQTAQQPFIPLVLSHSVSSPLFDTEVDTLHQYLMNESFSSVPEAVSSYEMGLFYVNHP